MSIGPTHTYDEGKPIRPGDRGGLDVAVGIEGRHIVTKFGTELSMLIMTAEQAIQFANVLLDRAKKLQGGI